MRFTQRFITTYTSILSICEIFWFSSPLELITNVFVLTYIFTYRYLTLLQSFVTSLRIKKCCGKLNSRCRHEKLEIWKAWTNGVRFSLSIYDIMDGGPAPELIVNSKGHTFSAQSNYSYNLKRQKNIWEHSNNNKLRNL